MNLSVLVSDNNFLVFDTIAPEYNYGIFLPLH